MSDLLGLGRTEIGDEHHRHILIDRWDERPLIGYLGMNPSYAGATRTDPSFTRFNGFARRWGFGGAIWGNLTPFRSPQPKVVLGILRDIRDGQAWHARDRLQDNQHHLEQHAGQAQVWLCGWGAGGNAMEEILPTLVHHTAEAIENAQPTATSAVFLSFGLTGGKAPKHVLARGLHRIPDDAPVFRFDPFIWHLGAEVPMPWRTP